MYGRLNHMTPYDDAGSLVNSVSLNWMTPQGCHG